MKQLLFLFLVALPALFATAQDTLNASKDYQNAQIIFQKAEYAQAETLFRQAGKGYTRHAGRQGDCSLMMTKCLIRQGKLAEATDALQSISFPKNAPQLAYLYNLQGELQINKGRNDLALKALENALKFAETQPHAQAEILANLGLVYWNTGNQELAYEYQQKALALRQARLPENHPDMAASYNDLGLIHSTTDALQAREYYQKALAIYQKIYGEKHPKIAIAYTNLAITYKAENKPQEALEQTKMASKIWEDVYGDEHPNTAFAYTNIGQSHADMGNATLAQIYLKKALDIYRKSFGEKHPEVANAYILLGNAYKKEKKLDKALENYQNAINANLIDTEKQTAYNPDILLNALVMKAETLEERHFAQSARMRDLYDALNILENCDALLDQIRRTRQTKNDKIALSNIATQIYEYAIRICLQLREVNFNKQYYVQKAFYFAEKSKSAVLLSAIADTEAKEYAGIPSEMIAQESTIKNNITRLEQKIANAPTESKAFQDSLFDFKRSYETFIQNLEKNYPDYYNLKYNSKITDLSALQAVLDAQTSLLLYFIAENTQRIYVFEVTQKKINVWDLPKKADLEKQINALRNGIKFRSAKVFTQSSHTLYGQLGLKKLSRKTSKVIIIPDGRLGTIPFEVLLSEPTASLTSYAYMPYLCKQKSISYAFSATLFVQNNSQTLPTQTTKGDIILCAPVDFSIHKQTSLQGSETEVLRLKEFFVSQGFAVKCYLHKEANKKIFTQLQNPTILHLATHGEVNEDSPEFSQILLAGKSMEEAHLYSSDIYNLRLPADLISLSACETGLGKVYRGEGIVGLTRALFYAGARNVAVSLWTVSDNSTAELMFKFYEQKFQGGLSYSEALREAKIALQMSEDYSAPYYWAAFILVGK